MATRRRKMGEPRILLSVVEAGHDYEGEGMVLRGDESEALMILVRSLDMYIDQPLKDMTAEFANRRLHALVLKKQIGEVRRIYANKCGEHYKAMVLGRSIRVPSLEETMRRTNKLHKEAQGNAD